MLYLDAVDLNGLVEVYELCALQSLLQVLLSVQAFAGASADLHKVLQEHPTHLASRVCHEDLALQIATVMPSELLQATPPRNLQQQQVIHMSRHHMTYLESCVSHNIWQRGAVVQMEVGDEHNVHFIEVNEVKVWQRVLSRVSWMDAAVQHDTFAPA